MYEDFRLRVFVTVAQTRSFTGAARVLDISQPAVSQNIAELEKSVGAPLFDRSHPEIALTRQGEVFRYFAERILKGYEDLNTVFGDFEAFVSISDQCRSLSEHPMFQSLKETFFR